MKPILKKKYESYREKEGTYNKMIDEGDKANQSSAEECNLRLMVEKYGIMPIMLMNQAKENLFLDARGETMTLNEKLKQREKVDEYFEQLPATVRKNYKDNKELFYQQLMTGEFDQMLADNILSQQQVEEYNLIKNKKQVEIENMKKQIEQMKGQINEYEIQINSKTNNIISDVQPSNNQTI